MMEDPANKSMLRFATFGTKVEEGFWHKLSSLKLNKLGIDESPIPITGFYAPSSHPKVPNLLTLLAESLPSESSEQLFMPAISRGKRNRCPVPGILYNTNTLEAFQARDEPRLIKEEAKKIWEDICSGKAEEDCSVLSRFLLVTFADLKNWSFHYWFAFPALTVDPPATVVDLKPAARWFSAGEAESVTAACNVWRNTPTTTDVLFFLVSISSNSAATIRHLAEFEACQRDGHKVLFGFYDPCNRPESPGWPLRNFLWFICKRWNLQMIQFFCYRENLGVADLELSLVGEASISNSQELKIHQNMPKVVCGEHNKAPANMNLSSTMDPIRRANDAGDLNIKLMKWRHLPSLNLDILSSTRCLLLGVGTLGCEVAQFLMGWGMQKITLVDSGKVAFSNLRRQSLYILDDCLNGGEHKAVAAVKRLRQKYPAIEAEAVVMTIPMPGHPVPTQEENRVLEDCKRLHDLIESHDAIFLLTDTRESRWLPSLLCANSNKITITAALGFDSYLAMRHGVGPSGSGSSEDDLSAANRLGCYFCNDVVAPVDSTSNRTLDQQCTVTRPGVAPLASAIAVELLLEILHHPSGISAKAEFGNSTDTGSQQPLGILPHQVRGSVSQFSQMILMGHASSSCTACSSTVVSEYKKRGLDFVLEAINHPTYLEDLTGLTELMKSASTFEVDWDDETGDDDEFLEI